MTLEQTARSGFFYLDWYIAFNTAEITSEKRVYWKIRWQLGWQLVVIMYVGSAFKDNRKEIEHGT
jgi:hypothetical protein